MECVMHCECFAAAEGVGHGAKQQPTGAGGRRGEQPEHSEEKIRPGRRRYEGIRHSSTTHSFIHHSVINSLMHSVIFDSCSFSMQPSIQSIQTTTPLSRPPLTHLLIYLLMPLSSIHPSIYPFFMHQFIPLCRNVSMHSSIQYKQHPHPPI